MHFRMSKSAQAFFSNIISFDGSHGSDEKSKFSFQFDVYYCCALLGMAACQIDEDTSDLKDLTENYPKPYLENKNYIAGLLVASEAKRQNIDVDSSELEGVMLQYLSNDDTLLSEEGVKMLNAYALKGFHLIHEFPLEEKPTSREEFLEAFNMAMQMYSQ